MSSIRVAIAGAGIGGLASALALRRAGIEAHVYERASELRPLGAGLAMWPNGTRSLRRLGLLDDVRASAAEPEEIGLFDPRGRRLSSIPTRRIAERVGAPMLVVGRGPLQQALVAAVGAESVSLGVELDSFEQRDGEVTLRFAGGREERADVLIGADGLRSVVRRQLVGASEPRASGAVAWRAAVELPHELVRQIPVGEYWGEGRLFGLLPMGRDHVYWFAGWRAPEHGPADPEEDRAALIEAFAHWDPPLSQVVEATPARAILRNALFDRRPARRWSAGHVTLAGDAAHPMMPNIGQGACQALEDALLIADELRAGNGPAAALARYERRRRRRAAAVVRQSRQMAMLADVKGPVAERTRNALLRATPAVIVSRRLESAIGRG